MLVVKRIEVLHSVTALHVQDNRRALLAQTRTIVLLIKGGANVAQS
jgi:hypothetical protein